MLIVPVQLLAQPEQSPSQPPRQWPLVVGILVVEAVAFGSGSAARSTAGARVVGAIDGVSGLTMLSIAATTERASGRPEFTIPYGLGFLGLSGYNFADATSSRRDRRFWVNVIGVNATVLASALAALALGERPHSSRLVRIGVAPGNFPARIAF